MRESRFPSERESRIEWWRRLILRQESSQIPLAEFCRQMGISTRKFYWRQRLREMDAASSGCRITPSGSLPPASAITPGWRRVSVVRCQLSVARAASRPAR